MRCFILFFLCAVAAQLDAQQFHFAHYPFDADLGDVRGNTLHFGGDELLYIGTENGLLTFNGLRFQRHTVDPEQTSLRITSLYSHGDSIWVGTRNGSLFAGLKNTLQQCIDSLEVPISGLARSGDGLVYGATYGKGLMRACNAAWQSPLKSKDLYAIQTCENGALWIGSDAGIAVIRPTGEIRHLGSEQGLRDEIMMSLCQSVDGLIWAGSFERGFCAINSDMQIRYSLPDWEYGPIVSIAAVDDHEIWISTEGNGVFRYARESGVLSDVELPGNAAPVIISMTADQEGNLWLLDAYRGLYRTNRRFESYPVGLENIQALLFDHAGNFLVGHAKGLYALQDNNMQAREILGGINVMSLYEDRRRNLWVGTFGQGLYCRPFGATQWHRYQKENGLTDESILSITGLQDTLWLATLGGVTRIQVEDPMSPFRLNSTNYNLADGLGTNFIYTAFADSKGRIWFGTDGNGLSVLEGTHIQNFQVIDTIQLHSVYSITEDRDGMIWFVTDRDGVFRYDGSAFMVKTLPTALQDHEISNIVADPDGNLLLAHTAGVDILTTDGHVILYRGTAAEPLYPNLNAHFVDSTQSVWIAGQHTILKYNPLQHSLRNAPVCILTGVSVFLSPIDFVHQHTFRAAENYLTFEFIGLWYTDPRSVTYRYKLEGLDPDWNETREQTVTYQNLSPGRYRFEVEASSSGQFGNGDVNSYAFEIRKPFYQTAVFILLATTLFFLGIYGALRIREQRINQAAALQRRQVESQLQTLKAQINPHFLFNSFNTLISVIEEDPRSAVEYVENLSDFYRSILQYREKNLISLKEELEIVKTYSYVLHKRYGSALRIETEPAWADVWIVPLVLQILVENAVKHNVISEHRPLTIRISRHDNNFLKIENTLQKRSVIGDSTGFGLQSIISRYDLLTRRSVQIGQDNHKFFVIIPVLSNEEISDHRR